MALGRNAGATTPDHRHPADQVPPAGKLAVLGIQHVLAFYAGAVVVPPVITSTLGLDGRTLVHLISADLFTCGIATIIQSAGLGPKIGVRLSLIQGITLTAVFPLIAIGIGASPTGADPKTGLATMYDSIIAAGLATFLTAPYFARLLRFFPPVVTGTPLTVMSIALIAVSTDDIVSLASYAPEGVDFGVPTLKGLAYAMGTLTTIVAIQKVFKGFMSTILVLLGLVVMTIIAFVLKNASFSNVAQSSWVGTISPFFLDLPKFSVAAIISMLIAMAVTAVETTGDVFATEEVVGKRIAPEHVVRALHADGLSTLLGGVLNSSPYTCFAQNVGLARLTRAKSRWAVTAAGVIMIILGLFPKAGAIVASIPAPVIGDASLAMFANVAVVGIQILGKVDMRGNRSAVIVSTSVGLAMLVILKPEIATMVPSWLQIIFGSGVTIGALSAFILDLLFLHLGKQQGPDVALVDGRAVSIDEVSSMERDVFIRAFSGMYESVTWPVKRAWEQRPFVDTTELRRTFEDEMLVASFEEQEALIAAYPDIVELAAGKDDERANQDTAALGLGEFDDKGLEDLTAASAAYHEKFHRPLVVCVMNPADHEHLISSVWKRAETSKVREARFALGEVINIADEHFAQLVADANPIRTTQAHKMDQVD